MGLDFGERRLPFPHFILALLLSVLACVSCEQSGDATDGTAVVVVIGSDLQAGTQLARLRVQLLSAEGLRVYAAHEFELEASPARRDHKLPLSLSVVPSMKLRDRFRVAVTGYAPADAGARGARILEAQVRSRFVAGQVSFLPIFLDAACMNTLCDCDESSLHCGLVCSVASGPARCDEVPTREKLALADDSGGVDLFTEGGAGCPRGAYPDGSGACVDIDECARGLDDCDERPSACVNREDARRYECQCPEGYVGNGRGEDGCQDRDECLDRPCDLKPRATCMNGVGSFACVCPEADAGWLVGDGRGAAGCAPRLGGLVSDLDHGLEPIELRPPTIARDTFEYEVRVPYLVDYARWDVIAPADEQPGGYVTGLEASAPALASSQVLACCSTQSFPEQITVTAWLESASTDYTFRFVKATEPALHANRLTDFSEASELGRVLAVDDDFVFSSYPRYSAIYYAGFLPMEAVPFPARYKEEVGSSLALTNTRRFAGAPGADRDDDPETVSHEGAVLDFSVSENDVQTHAVIQAAEGAPGDRLGASLAAMEDAAFRVVVAAGAPGNAGAVYLFEESRDEQHEWLELAAVHGPQGVGFGSTVAIAPTYLLVGAPNETVEREGHTYLEAGAAFLFALDETSRPSAEPVRLEARQPQAGAHFGAALSGSGTNLSVAAPDEDVAGYESAGAAYEWTVAVVQGQLTPDFVRRRTLPEPSRKARFGTAVTFANGAFAYGAPGAFGGVGTVCHAIAGTFECLPKTRDAKGVGSSLGFGRWGLFIGAPEEVSFDVQAQILVVR